MIHQTINRKYKFAITCICGLLIACDSHKNYDFKSSDEAIDACRTELNELNDASDVSIKKLTSIINDWNCLQEKAYNQVINDTTIDSDSQITDDFFMISDSIRYRITQLTLERERTMKDLLYMMVNTAYDRKKIQESEAYSEAKVFFDRIEKNKIYPNVQTTLNEYHKLMGMSKPFTTYGELLQFIEVEDKCFRSLMAYLTEVPQKDLQEITKMTGEYFDGITKSVSDNSEDEYCKTINIYLTMRFNRRIIQNAMVCREDIKHNAILDGLTAQNFRWMVIQPFFSIDSYSMAYLTEQQVSQMEELAEDIVPLLIYIDGKDVGNDKDEVKKLSSLLTQYFIKSYLSYTI